MNVYIWKDVQWYEPTANTILYVPMEDDLLDHSLTPKTLTTQWTVTLSTVSWVKCASANASWLYADVSWDWTNLTITGWIDDTYSASNTELPYWALGSSLTTWNVWFWWYDNTYTYSFINVWWPSISTAVSKNSWQLITLTKQWTTWNMYKWTTLLGSYNTSYWWNSQRINLWWALFRSRWFTWYMGWWVVENRTWSTSDIQDYYDISKNKYGIN